MQQESAPLIKDLERIIKKTKISNKTVNGQLDQIIMELEEAQQTNDFSQLKDKLQNQKPLTKIKQANNQCYSYISKMGKNMDKLYKKNLQYGQEHIQLNQVVLTELTKTHLLRDGQFEAYESLVKETGSQESAFHNFFQEIQNIVQDIKEKKLDSAIVWAEHQPHQSELLFELLKLKFVQKVKQEGSSSAINFIRQNATFQQMIQFKMFDIYLMTGSLAHWPNVENTKYQFLYDDEKNWPKILKLFLEAAAKSQNILTKSEIRTVFQAGCLAMPKLIKYNQITRSTQQNNKDRSSDVITNEIPIDIEIGKDFKYHSFFVCPVSREVTKPENPPMLLLCGHTISKTSVEKMTAPNKTKFKCPTCPIESKLSDLKQLIFI